MEKYQMIFSMLVKSPTSYGSHRTFRELSHRIARLFGEIEFGLAEVDVLVWSDRSGPTDSMFDDFFTSFRGQIPKLPTARFDPIRQRLKIEYVGRYDLEDSRFDEPTESTLADATDEFFSTLDFLRPKLRKRGDLEFDALASTLQACRGALLNPNDESKEPPFGPNSKDRKVEPWPIRFRIDWQRYHQNSREMLNDPFLWDPTDDESPHGANSGAWVVRDFRKWRQNHSGDNLWDFLTISFRRSGFLGRFNEFRATNPSSYVPRDGVIAEMHDRDLIALAFAALKVDGALDEIVRREAIKALKRRQDDTTVAKLSWKIEPKAKEVAALLEAKLDQF